VTLTLTLPDGAARLFHVKRCIQTQQLAHNVAQVWPQEDNP
jgi:hypothetical protein